MPMPGVNVRRLPFLSAPTWDISDDEICEWRNTPGRRLAGLAAERIRDGKYDNGQEIYPSDSPMYREITREAVSEEIELLIGRGMVRKTEGRWYAITPGRMEPSIQRAVGVILARRDDLPTALAAELDSWKLTLDAIEASGRTPATQETANRAVEPVSSARAIRAS